MPRLMYQCFECNICYFEEDLVETWCNYMDQVELYCPTKNCPGTIFWIMVQEEEEEEKEDDR